MANIKTISRSDYAQAQKYATKYDISISQSVKFFEDIEELESAKGKQHDAVRAEMAKRLGWASLKSTPAVEEAPAIEAQAEALEETATPETPHACRCGQLLLPEETKCATCIYWNANGLKRPATQTVIGRDGLVVGVLHKDAEPLELPAGIALPPFTPGLMKFISDETDEEIIERLKAETAQLKDERDFAEARVEDLKAQASRLVEENTRLNEWVNQQKRARRAEANYEDWQTDKPYEDRAEHGKGTWF